MASLSAIITYLWSIGRYWPVQALDNLQCKRRVLLSGTPMQNHLDEVCIPLASMHIVSRRGISAYLLSTVL